MYKPWIPMFCYSKQNKANYSLFIQTEFFISTKESTHPDKTSQRSIWWSSQPHQQKWVKLPLKFHKVFAIFLPWKLLRLQHPEGTTIRKELPPMATLKNHSWSAQICQILGTPTRWQYLWRTDGGLKKSGFRQSDQRCIISNDNNNNNNSNNNE